ncbi:MAG: LytR/AlgR family response regulator transcription factor [Thermonemataceae bacterium]
MSNLKVVIIEDEPLAVERLQLLLHQYDASIEILAILDSIEDTVLWFQQQRLPDLVLLDIHLSDGQSFDIFQHVHIPTPIIFTTAYDQYAIQAFKVNSIDYLLKPISATDLATSIRKYQALRQPVAIPDWQEVLGNLPTTTQKYRHRFLVKIGGKMFFKVVDDIAYFYADDKIVYMITNDAKKFIVEYTLEQLDALLDPALFFRISRKFIVKFAAIVEMRTYSSNRLKLYLQPTSPVEAIVSRDRVADFKRRAEL